MRKVRGNILFLSVSVSCVSGLSEFEIDLHPSDAVKISRYLAFVSPVAGLTSPLTWSKLIMWTPGVLSRAPIALQMPLFWLEVFGLNYNLNDFPSIHATLVKKGSPRQHAQYTQGP